MTTKHEPAEMTYKARYSQKYQVSTRRGMTEWNWWFNVYQCPTCQQQRRRLANLDRGKRLKPPVCVGKG